LPPVAEKKLHPDAKKIIEKSFLEHFLLKFKGCSFVPTSLPRFMGPNQRRSLNKWFGK